MAALTENGQKPEIVIKENNNGGGESIPYKKIVKRPRTLKENFRQQTLPAWQPIFSAGRVSPWLFLIGLVFVPIGAGIWIFSNKITEVNISYTDCLNTLPSSPEYPDDFNKSCAEVMGNLSDYLDKSCKCRLKFNLTTDLKAPVYIYYGLTNFYQNHRKYLSSRDDRQLKGDVGNAERPKEPNGACEPFDREEVPDDNVNYEEGADDDEDGQVKTVNLTSRTITKISSSSSKRKGRIYLPCGAIANSMFNDEIKLFRELGEGGNNGSYQVPLNRTGISWGSDQAEKFNNPEWFDQFYNDSALQATFVKPKNWRKNLWELDPDNPDNNGLNNEDLIVWMRVAALPTFRKLFRIVYEHGTKYGEPVDGLPQGEYVLEVDYHFPVASFKGTKTIILSTTSILGAGNPFLGIAYVITGTLCVLLGVFLLLVHVKTKDLNRKALETRNLLLENDTSNKTYYGT